METANGQSWGRFLAEVLVVGTVLALAGAAWRGEYISSWTHGLIVGAAIFGSMGLEGSRPYQRSWDRLFGMAALAFVVGLVAAASVLIF